MPDYIDSYSLHFPGMERDELEFALARYRKQRSAARRIWRRQWLQNRGIAVVAASAFVGIAVGLWELATIVLRSPSGAATAVGVIVTLALWVVVRAPAIHSTLDRRIRNEQAAREDVDTLEETIAFADQQLRARRSPPPV